MANMEVLKANYLNTTTQAVASQGGTSSVSNLFNRFTNKKWGSGDGSDATTSSVVVTFTSTQTVNRIALQDITFKSFKVYYDSNVANTFALTGALTTTSDWATNSETSMYMTVPTTSVKSIHVVGTTTMAVDGEKQIGEFWISSLFSELERNPDSKSYNAKVKRKEFPIEMSDGGTDIYIIQNNYKIDLRMDYYSKTKHDELFTIYNSDNHIVFVPEPTGTAWFSDIYAMNWIGEFDDSWTREYKDSGKNVAMMLREIPK